MKFSELVRLLERDGFRLVNEKGSVRYYAKIGHPRLIRADFHGAKEIPTGTCQAIQGGRTKEKVMIKIPYSLVIEATNDPDFFGFYSPDLEGFTGVGHSIEDCLYKAIHGMADHIQTMKENGLPVPSPAKNPTVLIQNERNKLQPA